MKTFFSLKTLYIKESISYGTDKHTKYTNNNTGQSSPGRLISTNLHTRAVDCFQMVRNYKAKRSYGRWKGEDMLKAVQAVRSGTSVRAAAGTFHVPRSTLYDHVRGTMVEGRRAGKPPAVPKDNERKVVESVQQPAMGFGISAKGLQIRMGQLMQELKMPKAFGGKIPGYDWFLGLKKRHSDLSLRRPEKLSSCHSKMLNKDVMDKYFSELEKVMNELDLLYKPHLIWNADESGFQMEHKPVNVVAHKGVRSVTSRASSSRESVSVLVTCYAAGRTMSPMLVVKGKTRKCLQSWDVESFPDAIWTTSRMPSWKTLSV